MREKDTHIYFYPPGLESKEIFYLIILKTGSLNKISKQFYHPNPKPDRNGRIKIFIGNRLYHKNSLSHTERD
jgi:hypothetical protein